MCSLLTINVINQLLPDLPACYTVNVNENKAELSVIQSYENVAIYTSPLLVWMFNLHHFQDTDL